MMKSAIQRSDLGQLIRYASFTLPQRQDLQRFVSKADVALK